MRPNHICGLVPGSPVQDGHEHIGESPNEIGTVFIIATGDQGTEQKVVPVLFFAIHQQAPFIICPIC